MEELLANMPFGMSHRGHTEGEINVHVRPIEFLYDHPALSHKVIEYAVFIANVTKDFSTDEAMIELDDTIDAPDVLSESNHPMLVRPQQKKLTRGLQNLMSRYQVWKDKKLNA